MKKAICAIASYIASIIAAPFTIIGLLVYLLVAYKEEKAYSMLTCVFAICATN